MLITQLKRIGTCLPSVGKIGFYQLQQIYWPSHTSGCCIQHLMSASKSGEWGDILQRKMSIQVGNAIQESQVVQVNQVVQVEQAQPGGLWDAARRGLLHQVWCSLVNWSEVKKGKRKMISMSGWWFPCGWCVVWLIGISDRYYLWWKPKEPNLYFSSVDRWRNGLKRIQERGIWTGVIGLRALVWTAKWQNLRD